MDCLYIPSSLPGLYPTLDGLYPILETLMLLSAKSCDELVCFFIAEPLIMLIRLFEYENNNSYLFLSLRSKEIKKCKSLILSLTIEYPR